MTSQTMTTTVTNSFDALGANMGAGANRLTFGRVVHSEWRKLFWLRSVKWSAALLVVLSWACGVGMGALALSQSVDPVSMSTLLVQGASEGWVFLAILMSLFGIFAITSEYGSGMIRVTASVVPHRTMLFWAKLLCVTVLSALVSAVAVAGTAVGAAVVAQPGAVAQVLTGPVLGALGVTVVTLVLVAVAAYALGHLLRASSGAITSVLGVLMALPIVCNILMMVGQEWAARVFELLPTALAGNAIFGAFLSFAEAGALSGDAWQALGGLTVWVVALLVPAFLVFRQRAIV